MDRWTIQELRDTDDISFAIQILDERRRKVNPYSPLGAKLKETMRTLSRMKENMMEDRRNDSVE